MIKSIEKEFIVISPDKTATTEVCDALLYQRLEESYNGFAGHELISCHEFDQDWASWECHPNGDEIVILVAGSVDFVIQKEGIHSTLQLSEPGSYVIIPKGLWHTAKTQGKTKVLFITPGEGTQNKPV